jgi:pyruvate dehydrogenase E2 component (dihydrolipoamide acetyltransferase)
MTPPWDTEHESVQRMVNMRDGVSHVQVGAHSLCVRISGMEQQGAEHGGAGAPLLLVHGFGGSLASWQLVTPTLARTRPVIAFDLPGHGESSQAVGEGSVAFFAGVTAGLLDALDVPCAHVVGHSLGGAVALSLLAHKPEKVRALSLLAPAGLSRCVNMAFIEGFVQATTPEALLEAMAMAVYAKGLVGRKAALVQLAQLNRPGVRAALQQVVEACFRGGEQAVDLRAVLHASPVACQIIWGREDAVLPLPPTEGLVQPPHGLLLEQTGHLPQLERPTVVAQALAAFAAQEAQAP